MRPGRAIWQAGQRDLRGGLCGLHLPLDGWGRSPCGLAHRGCKRCHLRQRWRSYLPTPAHPYPGRIGSQCVLEAISRCRSPRCAADGAAQDSPASGACADMPLLRVERPVAWPYPLQPYICAGACLDRSAAPSTSSAPGPLPMRAGASMPITLWAGRGASSPRPGRRMSPSILDRGAAPVHDKNDPLRGPGRSIE